MSAAGWLRKPCDIDHGWRWFDSPNGDVRVGIKDDGKVSVAGRPLTPAEFEQLVEQRSLSAGARPEEKP